MCLKLFVRITKEPTSLQGTLLQRSTLTTAYFQTLQSTSEESYITYTSFPLGNAEDNSPVLVVCSSNAVCAGRDKYQRNLKLLEPELTLFGIQEESKLGQERSINADWNLRTYLRLPWKPLIDVDGSSTLYVVDANSKIVKHIQSWGISCWQAVQQLPSDSLFFRKQS